MKKDGNKSSLHAIRDNPVYLKLKALGKPVHDKVISEKAASEMISMLANGHMDIRFATCVSEKEEMLSMFGKEEIYKCMALQGFSKEDLDVLCCDYFTSEALVLYRELDQSFWVWNGNLRKLGYHWTDLILPQPCFFLGWEG